MGIEQEFWRCDRIERRSLIIKENHNDVAHREGGI